MLKNFRKSYVFSSLAFLVVGLALLLWPDISLRLVCGMFGLVILVKGVSSLYQYAKSPVKGFFGYFGWIFGAAATALGAFLLIQHQIVVSVLPILVGLFVLFDGIMRVQSAFELRGAGYDHWWSFLLLALVSAVLGIVMIWNPFETVELLVMAIGVILLVEGALNLAGAIYSAVLLKGLKKAASDAADELGRIVQSGFENDGDGPAEGGIIEADWRSVDDDRR